jgi:hypothetical protein
MTKRALTIALLPWLVACGEANDDASESAESSLLPAPEEGEGVQLMMRSKLAAGTETERCMFYKVGEGGLAVNREEVRYTPGSHHVLLYVTPYREIPKVDRYGTAVNTRGVFDCGEQGPTAHWEVNGVAGGSQIAHGTPIVNGLPEDTAFIIPEGTVLLMNTHYLNASDGDLATEAVINLYTIPRSQVKQEAGILFWYNPFIHLPPKAKRSARETCTLHEDITLVNVQSHMHKRGVGYVAHQLEEDGSEGQQLFTTTEWEHVDLRQFKPGLPLSKGTKVSFECQYENTTDRTILQGLTTADEMCMLIGLYYPLDRKTELCGLDDTWDNAFLGAQWTGTGTADGPTTAACFAAITSITADSGKALFQCVSDSCPGLSPSMSRAARCIANFGNGECKGRCSTETDECKACVNAECLESVLAIAKERCD